MLDLLMEAAPFSFRLDGEFHTWTRTATSLDGSDRWQRYRYVGGVEVPHIIMSTSINNDKIANNDRGYNANLKIINAAFEL